MSSHVFDERRWSEQSIFWQLGNIGSEVGRALRDKDRNKERSTTAFHRGMDLINATVRSWVRSGKNPRELLIAREQFAKSMLTDDVDKTLEDYFTQFAIAERLHK